MKICMASAALALALSCLWTGAHATQHLSAQQLLAEWKLDHVFGEHFAKNRYDSSIIAVITKEDIDSEFPDVAPFHRRALHHKVQAFQARQLAEVDFTDYTGVHVKREKAWITFGREADVKLFRCVTYMQAACVCRIVRQYLHKPHPLCTIGRAPHLT